MTAYEPISLGHTCEVKYQLSRRLYRDRHPGADEGAVRRIFRNSYGSEHFRRHIFDFQITPFSSVCAYLEQDFRGVFEREDLFVDPATAHVTHRTLATSHPHDFEPPEGGATLALIDDEYAAARSKFDYLADRFRRHLLAPGRFLYVFMEMRAAGEAERLLGLLSRAPAHEAYLLMVGEPGADADYGDLAGRVLKAWRRPDAGKSEAHAWEGHDGAWDAALSPFTLRGPAAADVDGEGGLGYRTPSERGPQMNAAHQPMDTTALKTKGLQAVRSLFRADMKADLERRGHEVVRMRDSGRLTTDSQDSQGLDYDWFEPIVRDPALIGLVAPILGPDVAVAGWRILVKDKHFRAAVHIHQDWPYNPGDTRKLSVFVPLTRVNRANGGLIFLEESHFYGPVSMGPLDPSRFPPMVETCPDLEVGDVLMCDFLTWHYSLPPEIDEERIMIQLTFMPAADASSDNIVAGRRPHDRVLRSRFDASNVPSVELNAKQARAYLAAGDADRAARYAQGLVWDDPEHAGAALLLYDILSERKDPKALGYLEMARGAVGRLQAQIAARDERFGAAPAPQAAQAPRGAESDAGSPWRPVPLVWNSYVASHPDVASLPAKLATPETNWAYGAATDLVAIDNPATIRIRAKALKGKIGLCLITEDYSSLASDAHVITPEAGEATVMIAFTPDKSPARLLVRNHDDPGGGGEVAVTSVDIIEYA